MDTKTVLARLGAVQYRQLPLISRATGVPVGTLVRLKYGQTTNPRSQVVDTLREFFKVAA